MVHPLVSQAIMALSSTPVATSHLESAFSFAKRVSDGDRSWMLPDLVKALPILSRNRDSSQWALKQLACGWVPNGWSGPVSDAVEGLADPVRHDAEGIIDFVDESFLDIPEDEWGVD
jgi:hypothetical protein